jgi:hypothetical protein
MSGRYLIPWARVGVPSALSEDEKLGKDLWEWLEEQTLVEQDVPIQPSFAKAL